MPGYRSEKHIGSTCTSNYCAVDNGGCDQICATQGPGAVTCSCQNGYVLSADNVTCILYQCQAQIPQGCGNSSSCVVSTAGVASCACNIGYYSPDGSYRNCVSDPCQRYPAFCGAHSECVPLSISDIMCLCNAGYASNETAAVGSCATCQSQCTHSEMCLNQSRPCSCVNAIRTRAILIFYQCYPINACDNANGGCSQFCTTTGPNTKNCSCSAGFRLGSDQQACLPFTSKFVKFDVQNVNLFM